MGFWCQGKLLKAREDKIPAGAAWSQTMSKNSVKPYNQPADELRVDKTGSQVDRIIADAQPEKLRRSERVFIRIPVEVRGKNDAGKLFSEQTATVVINRHGARISLKAAVRPEDRVSVTNLQNSLTCPFRVVARLTKTLGPGPEWGFECLEPDMNFWGISFPEKNIERTPTPAVPDSVDALLECSACHSREFAQLTLDDYRQLAANMRLERNCPQCAAATEWRFGFVEAEEEAPVQVSIGEGRGEGVAERRRARRLTIKLPVKIRLQGGREEMARTENISKTGVCFSATQDLHVGERIYLAVGYSVSEGVPEVEARVVWRREYEAGKSALYGVHLEEAA
jgi:PilZ domain-containing protein